MGEEANLKGNSLSKERYREILYNRGYILFGHQIRIG
jgi:hypothetical protein